MSDSQKELQDYIIAQLEKTQNQFDVLKFSIGTSVLLAVISLNSSERIFQLNILGWSSYRIILLFALFSLIAVLLSFAVKERQLLYIDRNIEKINVNIFQKLITKYLYKNSYTNYGKHEVFINITLPEKLVTIFNNIASAMLFSSIAIFVWAVISG